MELIDIISSILDITNGVSQMEKEFEGKIKSLQKYYGLLDKNNELVLPQVEYQPEDEDVKQIIHEVLNELYTQKKERKTQPK
ncbi:MAG: hypothetical protein WBX81_03915 [Nitrososphaeraceae archaeon]